MFIVLSILIVIEILVVFWFIACGLQKVQRPEFLSVEKIGKVELRNYDDFVIFTGSIVAVDNIGICASGSKVSFNDESLVEDVCMGDIMVNIEGLKNIKWDDINCAPEFLNGKFLAYSFKCLSLKKGFKPAIENIFKFAKNKELKLGECYYIFTYGKGLLKNHEILVKVD